MKQICTLIAIISSLSLMACSRDRSPISEPEEFTQQSQEFSAHEQALPAHRTRFMSWQEGLFQPIHKYENECKDCPPSVAQILVKNFSKCFGGLVAENIVLASRHCLPKALQVKGANCKGSVRFLFSGNENFKARTMACDEVVDFIPEPAWARVQRIRKPKKDVTPHPDWVLLKTRKKMPRRMAEIQKDGIADGQKLFIYFPRFNNRTGVVQVKKIQCESVQRTPFFPFYIDDKSPMASIRCNEQLTQGSSGSNVYNEMGQIVGTLSHGLAYIKKGNKLRFKMSGGRKYTPWVAVNNIACILDVKDEDKAGCRFNPKNKEKLRKRIFLSHIKKAAEKAEEEFSKWQESIALPLRWETVDIENLDTLPQAYKKVFSNRQNRRKNWLNPRGNVALTKLFLPSYPKCLEKPVELSNIPHPYAEVRIQRSELRRVLVKVRFASTKGVIVRKNAKKWGFHFLTGHKKPRIPRSSTDFFHPGNPPLHHGQLSLCE